MTDHQNSTSLAQSAATPSLFRYFRRLPDPRRSHLQLHGLMDILCIAICAVISGANDWHQIVTFGDGRRDWLARFLALPNGIPSHDTFERVFARLDPAAFQRCFRAWVAAWTATLKLKHVAIDGKTLCGSHGPLGPLHLVSAWATEHHLVLGQVAVDGKSNEITAIPALLELLDLSGALVTIDAMGCQKAIAQKILDQGGDYLLTVKDNQANLKKDIQDAFEHAMDTDYADVDHDVWETQEQAHGREEKRTYVIITNPPAFRSGDIWPKLMVIGMCLYQCLRNGKLEEELRYFIGSKRSGAKYYGRAYRGHWGIENNQHWQLDISFHEDDSRVKERRAAENLALVRRLALMLLKRHPEKLSIAGKRYKATLSTDFLEEILVTADNLEKL